MNESSQEIMEGDISTMRLIAAQIATTCSLLALGEGVPVECFRGPATVLSPASSQLIHLKTFEHSAGERLVVGAFIGSPTQILGSDPVLWVRLPKRPKADYLHVQLVTAAGNYKLQSTYDLPEGLEGMLQLVDPQVDQLASIMTKDVAVLVTLESDSNSERVQRVLAGAWNAPAEGHRLYLQVGVFGNWYSIGYEDSTGSYTTLEANTVGAVSFDRLAAVPNSCGAVHAFQYKIKRKTDLSTVSGSLLIYAP